MLNWTRRIDGAPYEDIYVPSRPSDVNAVAWCNQFNGKKGAIAAVIAVSVALAAGLITRRWLHPERLPRG